jgi:RHS repeat-associated protein
MTDSRGHTWQYAHDVYDNRTVTTWPDLTTSSEVTDRLGRVTAKTDQNGNTMSFAYDALGRLLNVTDALGNVTAYSYDEVGNKLTQTDAEGRTTTWTYDALGRELTRTLPLGQQESHGYDAVGNRTQSTDFNGKLTTWTYDNRDRLDTVTYNDASSETFDYDAHGNRTGATDRSGAAQSWAYDNRHRLTRASDAAGNTIDYVYDAAGNKTQQTTTPFGAAPMLTNYGYDALNRLETVTEVNGLVTTYGYDENGNRASVAYPNGNTTSYTYDVNNSLTRQTTENGASVLLADYRYTLDPSGHRLQIDEPGCSTTYTYDDSYKLLTEDIVDPVNGDHSAVYEYDDVGNRTYSTINGVQTLYTYDANDRLLQQGGEVFTYDNNGNTLTKTVDGFQSSYTYDAKNHLASALLNEGGVVTSTTYRYDVDGIRIGKAEGVESVDYLVDHNRDYAQVVRETDGLGASIDYLYGDDLIQQSQSAADEQYFLYDGLGSTRLLTDDSGTITDRYDYEAFGSVIYREGVSENNYQFTGEQFDKGLGQYYLRGRYYDQSIGRFTQIDTWQGGPQNPLSLHKYLYAGSNPVGYIDPSGYFFTSGGLGEQAVVQGMNRILTSAATASFSRAIHHVAAGLVVAGLGAGVSQELKEFIRENAPVMNEILEQKRIREKERVARRARGRPILYHYTDRGAALAIGASGRGFVTPKFVGKDKVNKPAGFYATDIVPWDITMTQSDLSALFYGGNRKRNVSWFVAIDGSLFDKVWGTTNEFVQQGSGIVQLEVITIGPNLMLPGV